jgi:hypothetical protein
MSNDCGFTASSYQDLADLICVLDDHGATRTQQIIDAINVVLHDVAVDAGGPDTLFRIATQLRTRLGDPGSGSNIDSKLNDLATTEADISGALGDVSAKIGDMPTGYPSLVDLTYSFDQETSVANLATRAWLAVEQGGTSILDVVGSFIRAKFGGGSDLIPIGQWIAGIWDVPPVQVLTAGESGALAATQSFEVATGVYGYKLHFVVPGYWGQLSLDPVVYQPHIAVAAWRGPFGTVGPVVLLATPESQVYPVPPGATFLDIQLRPGITGTYRELRFLGL